MGRVTVKHSGNGLKRVAAIRLNLSHPEQFDVKQAEVLAQLIQANLAGHVESGLLRSAFGSVQVVESVTSKGFARTKVLIGDPSILTKPDTSPRGTIADFVKWLKGERTRRWAGFKAKWAGVRKEKAVLGVRIRKERAKVTARHVAAKAKVSKPRLKRELGLAVSARRLTMKYKGAVTPTEYARRMAKSEREIQALQKKLRGLRNAKTKRK